MGTSNPNRNKFLLGFTAVVAVLIVAFFMWPANVQKEDASGSIGAVQKHHAPQITQQDVILGNEAVKRQQQVLYKDFLADAGKLRAIGSRQDVKAVEELQAVLQMRAMRAAQEAADAASRMRDDRMKAGIEELNAMISNKTKLSNDEIQSAANQLGLLVVIADRQASFARMDHATEELSHISLGDENLALRKLAEADSAFDRARNAVQLNDLAEYFDVIAVESNVLRSNAAAEYQVEAAKLEERGKQNMAAAVLREQEEAARCDRMMKAVELAENRSGPSNRASILKSNDALYGKFGALADKLKAEETESRRFAEDLNALDARKQ